MPETGPAFMETLVMDVHQRVCQAAFGVLVRLTELQFRTEVAVLEDLKCIRAFFLSDLGDEAVLFASDLTDLDRLMRDCELREELILLYENPVRLSKEWGNSYTEALWKHSIGVYSEIKRVAGDQESPLHVVTPEIDAAAVVEHWNDIAVRIRRHHKIDHEHTARLLERELLLLRKTTSKADETKKRKAGRKSDPDRDSRIWECYRNEGMTRKDVAAIFKIRPSAVSHACRRHEKRKERSE